jgi:hypothetical protein
MKTEIEMMQDVIMYVNNLARGRSDNHDCAILTGNRVNKIEKSKAQEYLRTMDFRISEMAKQVENAYIHDAYEDTQVHASQLFMYVFDKTIETFYYTLIDEEPEIYLNIEEALDGEYYEISVPELLQSKVTKVVPRIVGIGHEVYEFMQNNGYFELSISKWLYFYLCAASSLAQQFLLEQDLNN